MKALTMTRIAAILAKLSAVVDINYTRQGCRVTTISHTDKDGTVAALTITLSMEDEGNFIIEEGA